MLRNLLNIMTVREFLLPSSDLRGIRPHVTFGLYITGQRIIWYVYNTADTLILGRLLNEAVLGIYSAGQHLANLPVEKVGAILNEVLLSSFSRIQDDAEKKGEYFVRGLRAILTISVPTFFGIALIAEEAVPLVLGDKWREAVIVVQILALVAPLKIVNSQGKPHLTLVNTVLGLVLIPPAMLIGAN